MKKAGILLMLLGVLFCDTFAGTPPATVDSLHKLLTPALKQRPVKPVVATIDRLNDLASELYEAYPDSTVYYASLSLDLATRLGYKKGIAGAYIELASVSTFRGDYSTAATNFTKALNYYQQTGDLSGMSESYIGLGRVQDYLGNYNAAIAFFNKALQIRQKLKREMDVADCYATIGITYDNMGRFSDALDCYFKALFIDIRHKDELAAADNYCNIGVIMQHLELYEKARHYFDKALGIWLPLNDKQGISTAYQNIGEVLMSQNDLKGAIGYLNKASVIFHAMNDMEGLSLIYYDLGMYNYRINKPQDAIRYLNVSLQSAAQYKIKYNKAQAYLGLAMIYNLLHNYAQAYQYALQATSTANNLGSLNTRADATLQESKALAGLSRYAEAYQQQLLSYRLRDSLKNDKNVQKLLSYNIELEFNKREVVIGEVYRQKLDKQRAEIIGAFVVIMIMAVIIAIYYRSRRKQQKVNLLLANKNSEIIRQQTDLEAQSKVLAGSNDLKDRLIAILAHDLRGPLSTLRSLFTLLNDNSISYQQFIDMAPKVSVKLEHTSDLLDTLLSWINIQVGAEVEDTKACNVIEVAEREIAYIDDLLRHKDLSITTTYAPEQMVMADPNCVRIVIHNLLTNAIKFSYKGHTIAIVTERKGTDLQFTVKDTGMGIDDGQLNSLFKNKVTSKLGTDSESGTGLGLFFCKDLIEKYHGKIWAESTPGSGARFIFTLPMA